MLLQLCNMISVLKVVISWLESKKQSSVGPWNLYGKEAKLYGGQISFKDILDIYPGKFHFVEQKASKKAHLTARIFGQHPFDSLHIWNTAIQRGLREVLEEIYEIRSSNNLSNLYSVIVLLQFFLDVIICYSNVLDRIYYPVMKELSKIAASPPCQQLVDEIQISKLIKLLKSKLEDGAQLREFLEGLDREVILLIRRISNILNFLETEVFSLISKNCGHEMQIWLIYISLQTVPLGLLKCIILWFSTTLSEDQFKSILDIIKEESPVRKKYFSSILREWFRTGYLGKSTTEKFSKDLQEGFSIGSHFLSEQIKADNKFPNLKLDVHALRRFNTMELESNSAFKTENGKWNPSSSFSTTIEKVEVSWPGKINVQMFFPRVWRNTVPSPKYRAKYDIGHKLFHHELRLVDHMFLFHKALIKDLDEIVLLSAKLSKNIDIFLNFQTLFRRLQLLYDMHSETEDGIMFPYLESKGKLKNVTHGYSIDHKLETEHFEKICLILDQISAMHGDPETFVWKSTSYHHLCLELHETCLSMQRILSDHFNREEIELGPLFGEYFSIEEQHKIIGYMLGGTRAEALQEIIPWLMSCLTEDEQDAVMSLWRKVTRSTNFHEWLGEWWEGMKTCVGENDEEGSRVPTSSTVDPLEIVSKYLWKNTSKVEGSELPERQCANNDEQSQLFKSNKQKDSESDQNWPERQDLAKLSKRSKESKCTENSKYMDQADEFSQKVAFSHEEHPLVLSQKDLETVIRRISCDSTLDSQKKSHLIQSLLMSRWMVTQQRYNMISGETIGQDEDIGQCPSYRDPLRLTFGCKHYKRNCKLLAPCCKKLYTCIRCHDELTDHSMDRKAITKMMCMKCLTIQPIGPKCSKLSCNNFSMARYYCKICKLFDDERQIYHCQYCNLCRVGKGLGIDYFHCMNCNACMSRSLSVHICREKCFEDNCPICHEYIFTSSAPVKALPCGHLMHSACFQEYTCSNYICPICSKSLGDMQVYFAMLDAFLAEEKIPDEYLGQTQVILCNDCGKRGSASFHWLYHKCPCCGSYNTRLL